MHEHNCTDDSPKINSQNNSGGYNDNSSNADVRPPD